MMSTVPADAGRSRCRYETSLRSLFLFEKNTSQGEIGWPGDLDVPLRAANYRHGMTESFDETRLIRSIVLVLARAFERFLQKVGTENLRGLREYEMLSRQCRFDEILF